MKDNLKVWTQIIDFIGLYRFTWQIEQVNSDLSKGFVLP